MLDGQRHCARSARVAFTVRCAERGRRWIPSDDLGTGDGCDPERRQAIVTNYCIELAWHFRWVSGYAVMERRKKNMADTGWREMG